MDNNNAADVLRELINTSRDGEKGYQDAAEHAKAADLKSFKPASAPVFRANWKPNWLAWANLM